MDSIGVVPVMVERPLSHHVKHFVLGFLCECVALVINAALSKRATHIAVETNLNYSNIVLPDLFQETFPDLYDGMLHRDYHQIADVLAVFIIVGMLILNFVMVRNGRTIGDCLSMWGHYWYVHSLILILRISTISVTILPSPIVVCKDPDLFLQCGDECTNQLDGYLPNFTTFYCNDMMFSGHTSTSILAIGLWYIYSKKSSFVFFMRSILTLCCIYEVFLIIITRYHYSADILVAIYITTMLLIITKNRFASYIQPIPSEP